MLAVHFRSLGEKRFHQPGCHLGLPHLQHKINKTAIIPSMYVCTVCLYIGGSSGSGYTS